jgi:hypothetical protein
MSNSIEDKSPSVFTITPIVRKPRINKGESLEVEVFVSGHGNSVIDNKLQVTYSSPKVYKIDKNNHVGYLETCIRKAVDTDTGKIVGVITGKKARHKYNLDATGTSVILNEITFWSLNDVNQLNKLPLDPLIKVRVGEMTHDRYPPVLIKLNTNENAPHGDHIIYLTLYYSDGISVKMDQKTVTFHINTTPEQHSKFLIWAPIIISIFMGIIITILRRLLQEIIIDSSIVVSGVILLFGIIASLILWVYFSLN